MRYLPKSDPERQEMLARLGLSHLEELFASIPTEILHSNPLKLPVALAEPEILEYFRSRAAENANGFVSLLGAGAYHHFRPVLVDSLTSRGEFFTTYTPYQAEISQGTLQAIFEFQTLICQLTGQEVANASLYEGATALTEAVLMGLRITKRSRVLTARSLHPEYREVLDTYARAQPLEVRELAWEASGQLNLKALEKELTDQTGVVAVQSPNFLGCLEPIAALAELVHRRGALLVVAVTEPISLGLLASPREADIVALEVQPFGLPPSYGGPYAGVIATQEKYVRSLPGRLAGQTTDQEGRRGFVLTLSTREQHIRREKATSNICTNQALCALAATIFLSVYGRRGLRALAGQNLAKAHYLATELAQVKGLRRPFTAPFFNEFVVEVDGDARQLREQLQAEKILAGVELGRWYPELENALLLCATEVAKRAELDRTVAAFRKALGTREEVGQGLPAVHQWQKPLV